MQATPRADASGANRQYQPPNPPLPPAARHRQIKAEPFCFQARSAIAVLERNFPQPRMPYLSARGIYDVMTTIASEQCTPHQLVSSYAYIASRCKIGEACLRRYLQAFECVGLITITAGLRGITILLLEAAQQRGEAALQQPTMRLADDNRRRSVDVAANQTILQDRVSDPATILQDSTSDPHTILQDRAAGTNPHHNKINNNKNKSLTNKQQGGGGVGSLLSAAEATTAGLLIAAPTPTVSEPAELTADQRQAIHKLVVLGCRRPAAERHARQHDPDLIQAWCRYAETTTGLNNPAGFVLARLKAGDPAPAPQDRSNQQPDFAAMREEYHARVGGQPPLPEEATLPPLRYTPTGQQDEERIHSAAEAATNKQPTAYPAVSVEQAATWRQLRHVLQHEQATAWAAGWDQAQLLGRATNEPDVLVVGCPPAIKAILRQHAAAVSTVGASLSDKPLRLRIVSDLGQPTTSPMVAATAAPPEQSDSEAGQKWQAAAAHLRGAVGEETWTSLQHCRATVWDEGVAATLIVLSSPSSVPINLTCLRVVEAALSGRTGRSVYISLAAVPVAAGLAKSRQSPSLAVTTPVVALPIFAN